MRSAMVILLSVSALLACESAAQRPPTPTPAPTGALPPMPIAVIDDSPRVTPPVPTLDDVDLDLEDPGPLAPFDDDEEAVDPPGTRTIHPHGGMDDCLEMYSACSPDPDHGGAPRCTSAPLLLACGQRGQIPGGDTLICACP